MDIYRQNDKYLQYHVSYITEKFVHVYEICFYQTIEVGSRNTTLTVECDGFHQTFHMPVTSFLPV